MCFCDYLPAEAELGGDEVEVGVTLRVLVRVADLQLPHRDTDSSSPAAAEDENAVGLQRRVL